MTPLDVQTPHPTAGRAAPRRILSICGGGLLGVAAAAMLERLEALGRAAHGPDYRLADSVDLAGGTSTGAVMATAVALGVDAERIAQFYLDDAPRVFRRRMMRLPGWGARFCQRELMAHFTAVTGDRRLARGDLACDLAVVVKALDTARPLLLTSAPGRRSRCMGAELIRQPLRLDAVLGATTAAPGLFRPGQLPIGENGAPVLCIDGGISPFNDPAELLWRSLIEEDDAPVGRVEILSLGSCTARPRTRSERYLALPSALQALRALASMVTDGMAQTDAVLRRAAAREDDLEYRKLDISLTAEALESAGLPVDRKALRYMRSFSDPRGKPALYELATAVAARSIDAALPVRATSVQDAEDAAANGDRTKGQLPRRRRLPGLAWAA